MPLLSSESLNDFFLPSQDCVKPVAIQKTNDTSEIRIDKGIHYEVMKDGTQTQLQAANISLDDCLACSGCVTTAESVLIGLQSWAEVEENIRDQRKRILVASVCPQSIASIATAYNLGIKTTFAKLTAVLKQQGFHYVVSTNIGRELSLHESAVEFLQHYRNSSKAGPLMTSACPGWICFAEKQKHNLLPSISKIRSPQQMMGSVLKDVLQRELSLSDSGGVYHVAIMPCFDKKLEASRIQFETNGVRDVDTVITSAEILSMILDAGFDFATVPEDWSSFGPSSGRVAGSSSGGYLSYVLRYAAKLLFDIDVSPDLRDPRIRITQPKTPKLKEYELLGEDGTVLLRFAEAYGFRQITSLVQRVAPKVARRSAKKLEYDYVEVMACEGGCINGGGQVKPPPGIGPKSWIEQTEDRYCQEQTINVGKDRFDELMRWWIGSSHEVADRATYDAKMTTTYSPVAAISNPMVSRW